ncbi:uncharacterized protein LOC128552470 [Mercenaria mercenaria]|uniref:uncharacterized protein LOC128552470 n=1 Tax=Mercenaria mercenaria TaxID=6596 RepID=UPI00234F543E|nr:uncharacterized protein LOC128552470 [Mercenaria mercenaria]
MQKKEEKMEFEMQNIKKGIADVTKDVQETIDEVIEVKGAVQKATKYVYNVKDEVIEVKGDVHTVTKDFHKLREDFKATDNRVDRLEKQRILEGTQKRGKKPSVLKRILEKLPFMRGQKKEETEENPVALCSQDEYIHMKKESEFSGHH